MGPGRDQTHGPLDMQSDTYLQSNTLPTALCGLVFSVSVMHLELVVMRALPMNDAGALLYITCVRERSSSVVECLTRVRGAAGSSLTGVTALWSLNKTNLS